MRIKRGGAAPVPAVDDPQGPCAPARRLAHPRLAWRGDAPASADHGDIYFSPEDGLAESRAVFLDGVGVPDLWQSRRGIVIGETGFGTGLNFLATWASWQRAPTPGRLHFVSVEAAPLHRDDLSRALKPFAELVPLAKALIAQWPPPIQGLHRLAFENGRVALTLALGDAASMLSRLQAHADAWYLDGFAPRANPEMWRQAVFDQIARLSAPGARLATFTAAGAVRRGLQQAGFEIEKRPGFAHKRERLVGTFRRDAPAAAWPGKPWFAPPHRLHGPVAVIGSGIAGAATAAALRADGMDVTLVAPAEGNPLPAAVLAPRPNMGASAAARLSVQALLFAWRFYDRLDLWRGPRGVLTLTETDRDRSRAAAVAEAFGPSGLAERLDVRAAARKAGTDLTADALWWPKAGCVLPAEVTETLGAGVSKCTERVERLGRVSGGWRLCGPDDRPIIEAAGVVVAAGAASMRLLGPDAPAAILRDGRLAMLEPGVRPRHAISYGGYLSPTLPTKAGPRRVLGATFDNPGAAMDDLSARLTCKLKTAAPALAAPRPGIIERWSGRRATSQDRLPFCGPVADGAAYERIYAPLRKGMMHGLAAPLYRDGLYSLFGLGSLGFQLAPLFAETIAALISGAPWPVEIGQYQAAHPARERVRALAKG